MLKQLLFTKFSLKHLSISKAKTTEPAKEQTWHQWGS